MSSPFENTSFISLYLEPVLLPITKTYHNILTLSEMPRGPLAEMVAKIGVPRLSEFHTVSAFSPPPASRSMFSATCVNALMRYPAGSGMNAGDGYMLAGDIPSVYGYLASNGYSVMSELTHMTNRSPINVGDRESGGGQRRLVCMFSYAS